MWLCIYILIIILILIYWYLKIQYDHWKNRNIFFPQPKLIFGNLTGKGYFWDLKILYSNFKQHKPFFGIFLYTKPILMITDLDLVKNIIIKDFDYFQNRGTFSNPKADPLTGHLINIEGDHWKNLRSKLTPTFSSGKMKYMFSTVVQIGERLELTLNELIGNNKSIEIEIKDLMSRYTIDVIGTSAFGIECNSLKDPNSEFNRIGNDIFNKPRGKLSTILIRLNFYRLAKFFNLRIFDQSIIDFFQNLVKQTIQYREENNIKRKDFMDLLIDLKNSENGNCITFNDILAQCFVFFAAGYETSSSNMTYTLYELAQNIIIQRKLRAEINTILDKYNGELSYESLSEMTYLEQVINESLRLYTPAPAVFRVANKDYSVPDTNYVIEKGTRILLPYGGFHLDPDYYPNPEKFDPERFNPENSKNRHSMAYIPFGDGPRNCIGMRFGKMESKIGLVLLLKNFKFSICQKTQIPIERCWTSMTVLQPKKLWLKVESIDKI